MKFRIKVEELNNGEKEYTPQVKVNWYDLQWENICGFSGKDTYRYTSTTGRYIYKTKEEALQKIEIYKTHLGIEESKKVKKTTYVQY
jgi:hypothetical protein